MKICNKHKNYCIKLDEFVNFNVIIRRFINEQVDIEKQDYIEAQKDPCPVCYLGFDGRKALRLIVLEEKNKRLGIKN